MTVRQLGERFVASVQAFLARRTSSEWLVVAVALVASAPAWIVKHPPLEDLAFHASTIRVLHSYNEAKFGLAAHYVLTLGRTQYLLYYLFGSALSYVMSPMTANRILLSVYLTGTPISIAVLCRTLGRDVRLGLFAVPLLFNVMYIFGLLPFVFGIPFMFFGLAAFAHHAKRPTLESGVVAGALGLATFYSHLFPFALLGVGCVLLFPWSSPQRWWKMIAPYVPLAVLVLVFLFGTAAGQLARETGSAIEKASPLSDAMARLWIWSGAIYKDQSDEAHWIAWFTLVTLSGGLALRQGHPKARGIGLVLLPALCFVVYFTTPESRGVVWLFCQRFPILGLFTLVPFLRIPRGALGHLVAAAAAGIGISYVGTTCRVYIACEREEVGDVDGAIEHIPYGKTVAALIFDRYSKYIEWAPYLHFGSYYQLERGGLLQFNYAPWPHWPYAYKQGVHPAVVTTPSPRWEWTPEQRDVKHELVPNYEYLMVKGTFRPPAGTYTMTWQGNKWSVWQRSAVAAAPAPEPPAAPPSEEPAE